MDRFLKACGVAFLIMVAAYYMPLIALVIITVGAIMVCKVVVVTMWKAFSEAIKNL